MAIRFSPYKKPLKLYHYILAAGVPAGPVVSVYSILCLYNEVPEAVFFILVILPMGWLAAGVDVLRDMFRMCFRIYADNEYIHYRLKKIYWKDLLDIKIINTSYVNELTEVQDDFDRILRLRDINRKKIYIPFYGHNFSEENIFQPALLQFEALFRIIEKKAGWQPGSLVSELKMSEIVEKQSAHDQTPVWAGRMLACVYVVLVLIVYVIPELFTGINVNELFQIIVLLGYPILSMVIIRREKKRNWEGFKELRRIFK